MTSPDAKDLGWNDFFASQELDTSSPDTNTARVFRQDREAYDLYGLEGDIIRARLGGGLSYRARDRRDIPAVGDWAIVQGNKDNLGTIVDIYDRKSCLTRQAASKATAPQVIAANIDTIFIVTSMNQEFNERRLERYLFAVRDGGAEPVLVLNKSDLADDPDAFLRRAKETAQEASVVAVSALSGSVEALEPWLGRGKSVALVGSSGVGKSTLINELCGEDLQKTGDIRDDDAAGRHTTVTRELIIMPDDRGILIDTPGLRELQLWAGQAEAQEAFDDIEELALECRFRDCKHKSEPGCAVQDALEAGELERSRLKAWRKLESELDTQRDRQEEANRRGGRHNRNRDKS